jgi:hypothetical protein
LMFLVFISRSAGLQAPKLLGDDLHSQGMQWLC